VRIIIRVIPRLSCSVTADEIKEEFIANGSHELRTSLTGIIGLSDMMPGQIVSGKGRRILVVDDEYLNLGIVQEHLAADYELILALSAHEALEMIETRRAELIITDLMTPVMDGFELCAEIRKKYRLDERPIIILTTRNRVDDLVQGMSAGAKDYIIKPFSKEELRIRINKQFELLQLMEIQREN
jgi:two-component system, sensor histidine kinase ChiS